MLISMPIGVCRRKHPYSTIGAVGSVYPGEPLGLEGKVFSYHWTHPFLYQFC